MTPKKVLLVIGLVAVIAALIPVLFIFLEAGFMLIAALEPGVCESNEKRLTKIQELINDGTWVLEPGFFEPSRKNERIVLTASRDFISELNLGKSTQGRFSNAVKLVQDVNWYDMCLNGMRQRNLNLLEAESKSLVAVMSGIYLDDCRIVGAANSLLDDMMEDGYWTKFETQVVSNTVIEDTSGDPYMVLTVSEKFQQPPETPTVEALRKYDQYYNAAALIAVCTGHSRTLKVNEPWEVRQQIHILGTTAGSTYVNDPIKLPATTPDW